MLPVMIGALFSMLQGFAALPYLTLGFPIALCCAMAWTWLHVRRLICEVHIYEDSVAIRTLHEAAHSPSEVEWKHILAITTKAGHADITLGLASIQLDQDMWPEWHTMVEALRHANNTG